jgi:hypothetical protein
LKSVIVLALLGATAPAALAQADSLMGTFGHRYTQVAQTPVWEVRTSGDRYQLVTLGSAAPPLEAHELSENERRQFWQTMWWPGESSAWARCVGSARAVICHVPPRVRDAVGDLKRFRSDYFYFDPLAGLMEAERLSR